MGWRSLVLLGLGLASSGCLSPELVLCRDGIACASYQVCAPLGGSCTTAAAIAACADVLDGDECGSDGVAGVCHQRVCVIPLCGNHQLEPGEACDDGNLTSGDGCSGTCSSTEGCGNGIGELAEECDCGGPEQPGPASCAGTYNGGNRCTASCTRPSCGNGLLEGDEVCDDGNVVNGDGCSASCSSLEKCGNGILDVGEECDDSNIADHDGCQSNCKVPRCGDGILDVNLDEECDDGNTINTDACLVSCRSARCGDGVVQQDLEECDDVNGDDYDGCASHCMQCGRPGEHVASRYDASTATCYVAFATVGPTDEAVATCATVGGRLPHVNNLANNGILRGFASNERIWSTAGPMVGVWLGLEFVFDPNINDTGAMFWTDSSMLASGDFQVWTQSLDAVIQQAITAEEYSTYVDELGNWQQTKGQSPRLIACQLLTW